MITYTNPLNMTPGDYPTTVNVSQYDSDFQLVFKLFSSIGTFTIPSGTTAEIRGTKLDGNGYSATASLSGTTVTVVGNIQMTAIAGKNVFEIVLRNSEKELSSANFILDVERAAMDKDTFASESVVKELTNIMDRADEIIDAAYHVDDAVAEIPYLVQEAKDARDDARSAAQEAAENVQFELEEIEYRVNEALIEAQTAARNAADDLREEMEDDIQVVVDAKNYINNYISDLIYGDEVRY